MTGEGERCASRVHESIKTRERVFFSALVALGGRRRVKEKKRGACVMRGHMLMLGSLAGDEKKHLSVLGAPGLIQAEQIPSSGLETQPGSNRPKKIKITKKYKSD